MQTVKNKQGTVLTEAEDVKNRWKENYQELYNNQNPVNIEMANFALKFSIFLLLTLLYLLFSFLL